MSFDDDVALTELRSFYAWGAGEVGRKVARALVVRGYDFLGFIDSSAAKWDQNLPEGRIFAPKDIRDPGPNVGCIISIWHFRHSFPDTAGRARALGFLTVTHFSLAATVLALEGVLPNYCIDRTEITFNDRSAPLLDAARRGLADEKSREVFDGILSFRRRAAPQDVPMQDDVWPFKPSKIVSLIDVGACIGEFCREALRDFPLLRNITAYEPDSANFGRLAAEGLDRIPGISFHARNAAVFDESGVIRFSADGGWGSHISADGDVVVKVVRLDDETLELSGPTLLKMDIEGAEIAALKGMSALLASEQLIAMVTIEHRAEDLFEIPEILLRRKGCSLFLRARDAEICMDACYISVPDGLI